MEDQSTYHIEVRGQIAEHDLSSSLEITIIAGDEVSTEFTVTTDQSGLIGLLRYLNGRGMLILSVTRR